MRRTPHRHGTALVEAIEQLAARDEPFRQALGEIWLGEDDLPPDVLARVVRASGNVIEPVPPAPNEEDDTPPI